MSNKSINLDVLAFAAHPDDVELSMSGTICKLTKARKKVGIIDLCQGEMGSRGTKESRKLEWEEASKVMQLDVRDNLKLPDGQLRPHPEFVKKVVQQIRKYKPQIVFAPHYHDRHPDHTGTSQIIKEAFFLAGNYKYFTQLDGSDQEAFRPEKLFYFMQTYEFPPSFIIDVTDTYEQRLKAIKAYKTQFFNTDDNSNDPQTFISKPEFMEFLDARSKFYGFKIGKRYGEPFYCEESIEYDIINSLKV